MNTRAVCSAIVLSCFYLCLQMAAVELAGVGPQDPGEAVQLVRAKGYLKSSLGTMGIAVDPEGNVYVPSPALHVVYKVSPANEVTIVAGTGSAGYSGDGGRAVQAAMDAPVAVSLDSNRNLYVVERGSETLRKITPDGNIQGVLVVPAVAIAVDSANGLFLSVASGGQPPSGMPLWPVTPERSVRRPPQFGRTPYGTLAFSESLLSVAFDGAGNLYIADPDNSRVLRISPDGAMVGFAGTGGDDDGADGGPAKSTPLYYPNAVAADAKGNVYIAEAARARIRKVTADGIMHTVDGPGVKRNGLDTGATPALGYPRALAVDTAGNLYVADTDNAGIRKVSPDGRITILAADESLIPPVTRFTPRTTSSIPRGQGLPVVAINSPAPRPWTVPTESMPATVSNLPATTAPPAAATSAAILPNGLQILRGALSSFDSPWLSSSVSPGAPTMDSERSRGRTDIVFKTPTPAPAGYEPARRLNIQAPIAPESPRVQGIQGRVELDFTIDESGQAVEPVITWGLDCELDKLAILTVQKSRFWPAQVNGTPQKSTAAATVDFRVDRGIIPRQPVSPQDMRPAGLAVDRTGTLYIATPESSRIRKVTPNGVSSVVGRGTPGNTGNGYSATEAELRFPTNVAVDASGNLYIADSGNSQVRAVVNGLMVGVVGRGLSGFGGDVGRALCADLNRPAGVAVDQTGAIYIADTGNNRIRKAIPNGEIRTIAGTGAAAFRGDGKPASSANLNRPMDVAVDSAGNVYVADTGNHRIRQIRVDGTIQTIAGTGAAGFGGDGASAVAAQVNEPLAIAVDAAGNVYIADSGNNRIRKISAADGKIRTIAGTGETGVRGDNGPAVAGQLRTPAGIAVDSSGAVYIADSGNGLIRRISADGILSTIGLGNP